MQQFKSGDRVKRTGGDFRDVTTGGIYIIDRIADGSDQYTTGSVLLVGCEGSYTARSFELVASAPQVKREFQIGDRVRMIAEDPAHGVGEVEVGDIGVIVQLENSRGVDCVVDFPRQEGWNADFADLEHEHVQVAVETEVSLDEAVANWQNVNQQIKELEAQAANYIRVMRRAGIKPV
ncbi:hypothetical protein [Pseudomonas phage COT4]|uniref:Uncharacterized protein n=1 Tax=Pseudomonas phage M5.1 TaxID=2873460 RepID=A0AAE9BNL9_9CAUD|nr:hypothetical protein QGX13_gp082 [Pseudomonas phage M5.1]UAV89741.1 hypothetical protein M51_160 [Pseudomonas phage M5.1]UGL61341.1 hypothetical protein [Pseudomonas phage COT4]